MWNLLMGTFPSHSSLGSSTFAMGQCTRQAQSAFSSSLQVVAYTRSTSWFCASEDVLPAVKNECGPYPGRVERSDSVRVSVSNARRCRNGVLNVPLTMWRRRGHCPCSMLAKSRGVDAAEGQRMRRLQRLRRLQKRRKNTPVSRPRSDLRKAVRASTLQMRRTRWVLRYAAAFTQFPTKKRVLCAESTVQTLWLWNGYDSILRLAQVYPLSFPP